jgi:hypothetical protein
VTLEEQYLAAQQQPSDINEHLRTLFAYASSCRHVTEMGTRTGVSTLALLAAQPETLVCYDIAHNGQTVSNLSRLAGKTDLSFRHADVLTIEIEPTDFLFIDTLHTFGQLEQELALHADKVSSFIGFHDTVTFGEMGEDRNRPGLRKAIENFLIAHPEWKVVHDAQNNNGFMVIAK